MTEAEHIGSIMARVVELFLQESEPITRGIQNERKRMRAKRKGDNFERQVAGILADHLGFEVQRVLLSGQRGEGDVQGVPGLHIECKRQEQTRLQEWFEHERPKANGKPLAIFHKKNRGPIMVTMLLDDWLELFRGARYGRLFDVATGAQEDSQSGAA